MNQPPRVHHCTVGMLMRGQEIDGIFYCGHGAAVGRPEPAPPPPIQYPRVDFQWPLGA